MQMRVEQGKRERDLQQRMETGEGTDKPRRIINGWFVCDVVTADVNKAIVRIERVHTFPARTGDE